MTVAPGRVINFLQVDDDLVDRMNVKRAFARANITCPLWTAVDGHDGLALLRSGQMPATRRLVLLDINMPRMNGLEMLQAVRADPLLQMTTVAMLTTSNDDRDRVEAFRLNVAGYLLKPVSFAAFVDLMAALERYWSLVELP